MLEDKIYQDYTQALRAKNRQKIDFLSLIRADIKNQAIDLKKDKLEDAEVLVVLKKAQKKLQDAKESMATSGRTDLLEGLEKELAILSEYLPKPLEQAQILEIVSAVISELSASSIKDMGKVMKEVLARVGVRADSKKVSNLVKEKLSA
ncbi:MAG: GatB/YqeY domain-containing protein [Candidatus Omnitrophica bacterium]|nr:GatB/YqeY domain-containing protein [Candidatus Omnitrophota bacterium]